MGGGVLLLRIVLAPEGMPHGLVLGPLFIFFAPVSNQYFYLFCPGKTCSAALSN